VRRRIPAWAWLPIGAALGLAAARLILAPRILERQPSAGASVPATAEIRITFNQAMDEASVIERLHVDSSQLGETIWQGATLIYRPQEPWASGSTVEVRLDAGARSRRGLAMVVGARWSFSVSEPRLIYLWPADGPAQVYARTLTQTDAVALTAAPGGVVDFSIGARGTRLVYVAGSADESTELRELDLVRGEDRRLFDCPGRERCLSPELSPDGSRLAFVREAPQAEGTGQMAGRVWMLEAGGETPVPVSPEGDIAFTPFWSPQGWLAFVDVSRGAILVVDVAQGEPFSPMVTLPSSLGDRGVWSLDGSQLIFPDLLLAASGPAQDEEAESLAGMQTHLFRWDVSSGTLTDLTAVGGWRAEDGSPTYTPDGDWVIFNRRLLSQGDWTSGKQLWRMRPDGSQSEQLTDEAFINYGAPAVGPSGDLAAYLRFNLEAPLEPAQIWSFDIGTRGASFVVEGGYLPAWIP